MIGQTWASEMRTFKDAKTGRTVTQLTSKGNNVHLYFTENSFDAQKNEIIFYSDRASGQDRAPHEEPHFNLFRMSLDTGEMVQLTDEPETIGAITKTPDSRLVVYKTGKKLRLLETATGKISTVYEEKGNFNVGSPSISRNERYIAFSRNENVRVPPRRQLCWVQGIILQDQRWPYHCGLP